MVEEWNSQFSFSQGVAEGAYTEQERRFEPVGLSSCGIPLRRESGAIDLPKELKVP
jgi:hypothetical protein